jgi:drug/metabolite transporter (DMT)-like permease
VTGSSGAIATLAGPFVLVMAMSAGQILFKIAAGLIDPRNPLAEPKGLMVLVVALTIYAAATLLWIAMLRGAPLSRIYPIAAFSFVLVPLASLVFLKEQVSWSYWGGVALIVAGVAVTGRSSVH